MSISACNKSGPILSQCLSAWGMYPKRCHLTCRFFEDTKSFGESVLPQLVLFGQSLCAWCDQTAAMWCFRPNSGITEGFHTVLELIKRRAFGLRDSENQQDTRQSPLWLTEWGFQPCPPDLAWSPGRVRAAHAPRRDELPAARSDAGVPEDVGAIFLQTRS